MERWIIVSVSDYASDSLRKLVKIKGWQTVEHNSYDQDPYAKEFGIRISEKLAYVQAQILPAPWLKYRDTGKEKN
ncbi:hypothetical protein G4B88_005845 [Cannabis sativa]|uniref:Argonaute linker 2 domain-containing protein n=1 Tax=Cannabis sativa TaxID=3483 RepID=A0A7J6IBP2_CANSA|nr:hypothetical protein G4B88_005845 [Cannabis sativa]